MRIIGAVSMMVLFLLITFQQAIIVVHFKFNQQLIGERFCVNKNKPELLCFGQCFLKKELKEKDNTAQPVRFSKCIDIVPTLSLLVVRFISFSAVQKSISLYKHSHYEEPCLEVSVPPPIRQKIRN